MRRGEAMEDKQESLVMSISQLATALSISKGLCYELAKTDRLPVPVIRCGRRLAVARKSVEALLSATKNGNVPS